MIRVLIGMVELRGKTVKYVKVESQQNDTIKASLDSMLMWVHGGVDQINSVEHGFVSIISSQNTLLQQRCRLPLQRAPCKRA